MNLSIGVILREIRLRSRITLRNFCLSRNLDPNRYSLIERNLLTPNESEVEEYLKLIKTPVIRGNIRFKLVWYDIWIGIYVDKAKGKLYFCPFPCCCFIINLRPVSKEAK